MYNKDYLAHYGVLGMKWGKRNGSITSYIKTKRSDEKDYRKKMTKITKNKYMNGSDRKRFEYRNQHIIKRVGKTAATSAVRMVLRDVLMGDIKNYNNPYILKKRLGKLALNTAANVALNDALAKSASKRYSDDGKRIKGKPQGIFTKEQKIESLVKFSMRVAPIASMALSMKASSARKKRAANEAAFKKMGARILAEKVSNFVDADYIIR